MSDTRKQRPIGETVARIVGSELNDAGECIKHQPRPFDPRQYGCPLVDSITGKASA